MNTAIYGFSGELERGFFKGKMPQAHYRGMFYGTTDLCVEASTVGFRPFSAFCAKVDGECIERLYQNFKIIDGLRIGDIKNMSDHERMRLGKGKKADNADEVALFYAGLWDRYIAENPHLKSVLTAVTGIGDVFGREGHCCQSTELWRIRADLLGIAVTPRVPNRNEVIAAQQGSLF